MMNEDKQREFTSEQLAWLMKNYQTCQRKEAVNALGYTWGDIVAMIDVLRKRGIKVPKRGNQRSRNERKSTSE